MEAKEQMIQKYKDVKVKHCLEIAGDKNKYQKLIIVSMSMFCFFVAFQYYMFPYIFFEPSYECLNQGKYSPCTAEQACLKGTTFKIISGNVFYLTNKYII